MKKILIFGHTGQDGQLFWDKYKDSDSVKLIGVGKSKVDCINTSWDDQVDVSNYKQVSNLIKCFGPEEIYYLAACNQSSQDQRFSSMELLELSLDINLRGIANILEVINQIKSSCKVFYAATSMVFEGNGLELQSECSAFTPKSIYSITKATAVNLCRYYRENHDVFVNVGLLFNHESKYRKKSFLSKKIMTSVKKISQGELKKLELGTLDAEVDWSYAPDFIVAMEKTMLLKSSEDFIFSSGEKHTVREFVEEAFLLYDLDWRDYVVVDQSILNRKRSPMIGDNTKLKKYTGWRPSCSFKEMIAKLRV